MARGFAGDLRDLLNRTVVHGVPIGAVLHEPTSGIVGYGVTERVLYPRLIPLKIGRKPATAYLRVAFTLTMDPEGEHLAVSKSNIGLYADDDLKTMVFHYDFEREPGNDYPEAHAQVAGQSETLATVLARASVAGRSLRDLHLPVGGRRFRPTVEDVVEFLVVEGLVEAHRGWEAVVKEHREQWTVRQVKAAVRRYHGAAAEELGAQGYGVSPPVDK